MDRPRRQFLARAALAGNQDRHIHFRRFLDAAKQGLHDQAVADQPVLRLQFALLAQGILGQRGHAVSVAEGDDQALRLDGQGMVVVAVLGDDGGKQLALDALTGQHHDPLHFAAGQNEIDQPLNGAFRLATEQDGQTHFKGMLRQQRSGWRRFLRGINLPIGRRNLFEQILLDRRGAQN